MKKIFTLFMITSLIVVMSGCAKTTDINDTPSPQSPINGDENGDINENVNDANIIDNDVYEDDIDTTSGISGAGTYLNSLRGVDSTLRQTVTDMDAATIDVNDKDYITKSADYYKRRAAAYQTALNSVNGMTVDAANRSYNDSIVSYYQNGYDTYNNLATKYGTFKTIDDETAYKNGLGKTAYDIKTDLRSGYENALNALDIDFTTNNGTTTNKVVTP